MVLTGPFRLALTASALATPGTMQQTYLPDPDSRAGIASVIAVFGT